ncbi:hypothetical protein F4860DRAFT_518922 [Xylaria cubensis]|nr:hypothetical protein F4860DRAFT_518922 [Xylaria cubensis]
MAPPTTPAKPVKKWDDTMVAHLFLCIYNTVDISFTPENKTAIETMMNEEFNHSVGWNGIRFYPLFTLHRYHYHFAVMSSPRALMKWDPKVHEDILVAISDVLKLGREDWARVIQALHTMGYSFTESALK